MWELKLRAAANNFCVLHPFPSLSLQVKMIAVAFLVMSLCSVVATPIFGFICDSKV